MGRRLCKRLRKRRQKPLWTADTVVLKVVVPPEARAQREDGGWRGGRVRSARLNYTATLAAQLEGVGGSSRRGLAESQRTFGGETGLVKWPRQDVVARAVVV